jgi:thymidylate kinase
LRRVRRFDPDIVYYVPRSGVTRASVLRAALLAASCRDALGVTAFLQAGQSVPLLPKAMSRTMSFVLSDDLRDKLASRGIEAHITRVGVERPPFVPEGAAQKSLWPQAGRRRILHVGSLTRMRNLDVLGQLAQAGHSCVAIGSTSTAADLDVIASLRAAGVHVVRDFIPDIASVYRAADAYVFPVRGARGCIDVPLSVMEALACGVPVVATPWRGLRGLRDSFPGLVIAHEERLCDAVEAVLRDPPHVDPSGPPSWAEVAEEQLAIMEAALQRRPRRRLIALIGLDGSGKSTHAAAVARRGREEGLRTAALWARWDPLLLRPAILLARQRRRKEPVLQTTREFVAAKQRFFRRRPLRLMWMLVASADHALQVLPRLVAARRRADVVVLDRYYYDTLVDFAVNFGTDVSLSKKAFLRLFPEPDKVILLDAAPETLAARKTDVESLDYLRLRRPLYLRLAAAKDWEVINAGARFDEVTARVERAVWET